MVIFMTRIYLIGTPPDCMKPSEAGALTGVFPFPVNYRNLGKILKRKRTIVAMAGAEDFISFVGGLCRNDLYGAYDIEICCTPEDFNRSYEMKRPDVVLTDTLRFAEELKSNGFVPEIPYRAVEGDTCQLSAAASDMFLFNRFRGSV